jgi:hypothetical protein
MASTLCDTGHTKGRSHMGGIGKGKETKNLNVVNMLSEQEWIQESETGWGHHGKGTREEWRELEEMNQLGGTVIHMCMKTTHRHSLCSYLYLKLAQTACFSFIFHHFSSRKLENSRVEQVLWVGRDWCYHQWEGAGGGVKGRRMNMMEIMYTHGCKLKKWYLLKLLQELGLGHNGEWWRGWIQVWYIWYILRTSVSATIYSHSAQW